MGLLDTYSLFQYKIFGTLIDFFVGISRDIFFNETLCAICLLSSCLCLSFVTLSKLPRGTSTEGEV
jgi:hypothetical protein